MCQVHLLHLVHDVSVRTATSQQQLGFLFGNEKCICVTVHFIATTLPLEAFSKLHHGLPKRSVLAMHPKPAIKDVNSPITFPCIPSINVSVLNVLACHTYLYADPLPENCQRGALPHAAVA